MISKQVYKPVYLPFLSVFPVLPFSFDFFFNLKEGLQPQDPPFRDSLIHSYAVMHNSLRK